MVIKGHHMVIVPSNIFTHKSTTNKSKKEHMLICKREETNVLNFCKKKKSGKS